MAVQHNFLEKKIYILAENTDGRLCMLEADDYNELVTVYGDHSRVPPGNAKVFFASYCGKPISPYVYSDFLSLLQYISRECCYKWEKA